MGERKRRLFQDPDRGPFLDPQDGPSVEAPRMDTLGASLRRAREASGVSVAEVAQTLRIRAAFLQALEDGRHKDLPGATYALGFLRTYAEHLSLDPELAVRRFKEESSGAMGRSQLYMPQPVAESRIPGGTMLLAALVLGGAVYGSWYYVSSTGRELVDLVPPLPDQIAQVINPPPAAPDAPFQAAEPERIAPAPAPAPATPPPPSQTDVIAAQAAQPVTTPPATAAPASPPATTQLTQAAPPPAPAAQPQPQPQPQAQSPAASQPPAEDEEEVPASPSAIAQGQPEQAPAASQQAASQQTAALPPTDTASAPEVPPSGRVYGTTNGASRIQLRAVADAWVQVRSASGDLLFARVLRAGDVYRAPDQPGLRLVTGNAGGLQVAVDGGQAQVLGNTGQVLRDVPLDRFAAR